MNKLCCIILMLIICEVCNSQTPDWEWAYSAGGSNTDEGRSVATDINGNIIMTGYFEDTITFGAYNFYSGGMFVVKFDYSGNVLWAKSARRGNGKSVTTDLNGNIYLTGGFVDSITFGTITLNALAPFTGFDVYIVKYDSAGNELWAKAGNGEYTDWGNGIAVDKNGNVFITGEFGGNSITFGTITVFNSSWGSPDLFLTKYDSNGNVLWVQKPYGNYWEESYGVALDTVGNVFITGTFASPTLDFGPVTIYGNGTYTFFVAKFDNNGSIIWAKSAGGIDYQYGNSVATDENGNAYIVGHFDGKIVFGTDTLTTINFFSSDIFVVKYDLNGNAIWAHSAGGNGDDEGHAIAADSFGNTTITGNFSSDSITFNGNNYFTNNGFTNIFISKYDSNGNSVWATTAGGSSSAWALGITTDENENTFITGKFQGQPISFGTITLSNEGWVDLFIAKLASDTITSISNFQPLISNVEIFPNPARDELNINTRNNELSEIILYDITSRKFLQQMFTNSVTLNTEQLAKGIYLYEVRNKNGVIKKGKVVKD